MLGYPRMNTDLLNGDCFAGNNCFATRFSGARKAHVGSCVRNTDYHHASIAPRIRWRPSADTVGINSLSRLFDGLDRGGIDRDAKMMTLRPATLYRRNVCKAKDMMFAGAARQKCPRLRSYETQSGKPA
jgi:hypothetical protein